jgi:hypothetical protein
MTAGRSSAWICPYRADVPDDLWSARCRGQPKTRLDHVYMAAALNLLRLEAFRTGTPLDRQRTSHLARLELGLAA